MSIKDNSAEFYYFFVSFCHHWLISDFCKEKKAAYIILTHTLGFQNFMMKVTVMKNCFK